MNMLLAAAYGQRIEYLYEPAANQPELALSSGARSVDLDSFIAGACNYLATHAKESATVGTPYIAQAAVVPLEFTASIRITGTRRGAIYFTASRAMLTIMLMRRGETDITTQSMCSLLRELAGAMTTIARRDIGRDYLVWEPSVSADRSATIESRVRPLVVPIHWRKFTAQMVLCME